MKHAKARVRRLRAAKAAPAGGAVHVVRDPAAVAQDAGPGAAVARETAGRLAAVRKREPAAAAWAKLAAPLKTKQGIRVGCIGITGSGKTTGVLDFLAYLEGEHLIELVIVHDVKLPKPQYTGQIIHDANVVLAAPPESYPAVLVLRRQSVDHMPSVEDAARVTKVASYNGIPTMLVLDEFKKALSPSGKEFEAPTVGELLSEGRGYGASLLWLVQLPQRAPTEAFDQSQIILFRCGKKVLSYLIDQKVIDQGTADVVGRLHTGEFVLVSSEEDFDGVVYKVPPPAAAAAERAA